MARSIVLTPLAAAGGRRAASAVTLVAVTLATAMAPGASARMLKPVRSKTENMMSPLVRATESAGESAVIPLTPVAIRVMRTISPVASVRR